MELHTAFDLLSEVIERYERGGHTVRHAEVTSDERRTLHATLELTLSLDADDGKSELTPEAATVTDDGGFGIEFSTASPQLPAAVVSAISFDDPTLRVAEGGELLLAVTLAVDPTGTDTRSTAAVDSDIDIDIDTDTVADTDESAADGPTDEPGEATGDHEADSAASGGETTARLAAVRDDSLPPYEDTAYLQALYDSCETFAEMSRVIEMDVAGETVRRYMIDAGIHTPTSYRTRTGGDRSEGEQSTTVADSAESGPQSDGSSSDEESTDASSESATEDVETVDSLPNERLVADGIGLPDDLSIEEVVDAVTKSSTVYEVQRELGLEHQRTWELLRQLDLLELLLGRLSDGPRGAVSSEVVTGRIRRCIAKGT